MFNIGDKVRIINAEKFDGNTGIVVNVDSDPDLPYNVKVDGFDDPLVILIEILAGQEGVPFAEHELELIDV
jgi:hypothetical protein